jgi:hypothetical protein
MMTKQIFTINDFENLEWIQHPIFPNSVRATVFFDNGYGASIITEIGSKGATGLFSSFISSYGSRHAGTHEIAVIKKINSHDSEFHMLENMDDFDSEDAHDYLSLGGIWANMNLEKTLNKVNLIACL